MSKELILDPPFNIWQQKLTIGAAILDIGLHQKITLSVDETGGFIVASDNMIYYPTEQGPIENPVYIATITVTSAKGDWPKHAAEDLLWDIDEQIRAHLTEPLH